MLNQVAAIHGTPTPPPPTVTGGTLYTSGGFNYRVFTGNGTLGISGGTLSCDVLVVAGGGGGGYLRGGGGGAGGALLFSSQSLTAGNYTATIGAGGAGGTTGTGTNGVNSSLTGLTTCVGGGGGGTGAGPGTGNNGGSGGGGAGYFGNKAGGTGTYGG